MPSTIRGSDNFDTAGGNAVKAWVNFNGTGTVAIRASFNVSSITDVGTGTYTVNFTAPLVDSNYVVNISSGDAAGTALRFAKITTPAQTASAVTVGTNNTSTVPTDEALICVSVFR